MSRKRPSSGARRKPRGITGGLRITGGQPPEFIPNELPDEKNHIEAEILDRTIQAAAAQNIALYEGTPVQNEENDFGFTIPTANGNEYLDLVEFVFTGGYSKAASSYRVGDMAERMFDQIRLKARKYGHGRKVVVHLLIYSTHWKFLPSESVIQLLTLFCAERKHGFKTIAVMAPIMDNSAIVWRVFPADAERVQLNTIDPRRLRGNMLHQFDARDAKLSKDGSGVFWELPQTGPGQDV